MNSQLSLTVAQASSAGKKISNQDCHGYRQSNEPQLSTKGVSIVIADGISSSDVSDEASQSAVRSFLEDYYCTSETWSVQTSAERVIQANNSWLFAQNQREMEFRLNRDKGYVCTFTALVIKSNTAHILHVGDTQVCRLAQGSRQQSTVVTEAHRLWVSNEQSYLSRALGASAKLEIDYTTLSLELGDMFMLSSDGVHEYVSDKQASAIIDLHQNDLNTAADRILELALANGSDDNLTVQLVRIDSLPSAKANEFLSRLNSLPMPPELSPRMQFDGYKIIRDLHISSRSHVMLAEDINSQTQVVIKVPSTEGRNNKDYLERFLMEDWIAQRLNNAHIVKAFTPERHRSYNYVVSEFVDGCTLAQWMADNPNPGLATVRSIIRQIATGVQAFHRQEMLHQDLRPHNIMIDSHGTAKIIDFGSTYVSGVEETHVASEASAMPGTAQFLAPEYFIGEFGSKLSDQYSLACLCYHMLSGRSPYGSAVARALSRSAQQKLRYQSVLHRQSDIPAWVDLTLKKALHPEPSKRYNNLSEFIQDLRKPNAAFLSQTKPPLLERNPVRFWQGVSSILLLTIVVLSYQLLK